MNYEDLDYDTQSIIDTICLSNKVEKEKAILILCEIGMLAMQAAVLPDKREKINDKIRAVVQNSQGLTTAAEIYSTVWFIDDDSDMQPFLLP